MIERSDLRRRHRAPAPRRAGALDVAVARIGMMLDAPRAGLREETTRRWRDAPSVVDTLLRAASRLALRDH